MSDSEQQLADDTLARWREMNTDPREQSSTLAHERTVPLGGTEPRKGHSRWFWLVVSLVILVVIYGGLGTAGVVLSHDTSTSKVVSVGNAPRLVLTLPDGSVHIVSGPEGQISVVMHQRVFAGNDNPTTARFVLSPDGNTLSITVPQNVSISVGLSESATDFDIVAPPETALAIHTASGDISASGINGQMALQTSSGDISTDGGSGQVALTTSSGDITAQNVSGQLILSSTSGAVHATNVSGTLALSTSSGTVTATNAAVTGDSSFDTSSGDINFSGTVAPGTHDDFHTSNGNVTLALPRGAAFQIRASTSVGSIDIDSAFSTVVPEGGTPGSVAVGVSGSSPYADISIEDGVGDIHLRAA